MGEEDVSRKVAELQQLIDHSFLPLSVMDTNLINDLPDSLRRCYMGIRLWVNKKRIQDPSDIPCIVELPGLNFVLCLNDQGLWELQSIHGRFLIPGQTAVTGDLTQVNPTFLWYKVTLNLKKVLSAFPWLGILTVINRLKTSLQDVDTQIESEWDSFLFAGSTFA